jgi:DNA-binding transcriptional ArsR family regulator
MDLIEVYQCLCDTTRLRILHLLIHSPLCVCHFQDILGVSQVKISKHLKYLKSRNMVAARRQQNWMIYSLPKKIPPVLAHNLKCLDQCVGSESIFKGDLRKLTRLRETCCQPKSLFVEEK